MKALICTNINRQKSVALLPAVLEKLTHYGITPLMTLHCPESEACRSVVYGKLSELAEQSDIFITVGGDGTILRWGKKAAEYGKCLLGINTGRLGFMATLECNELDKLKHLTTGKYSISRRMLMKVRIEQEDSLTEQVALNDVVLFKNTYAKLPEFSVSSKGSEVSRIRADGLIFATPTGSTAYSLSAGGPIIEPELDCIEFTPLCAHTLFGRPMIFTGKDEISVTFSGYEGSKVFVSVDGDNGTELADGNRVLLTRSELVLELIDIDGNSFYSAVHNKLMQPLK